MCIEATSYAFMQLRPCLVIPLQLGALTTLPDGKVNPYDGRLTMLGKILADLPIDAKLGKLILLGYVFDLYEHAVIIGNYNVVSISSR